MAWINDRNGNFVNLDNVATIGCTYWENRKTWQIDADLIDGEHVLLLYSSCNEKDAKDYMSNLKATLGIE